MHAPHRPATYIMRCIKSELGGSILTKKNVSYMWCILKRLCSQCMQCAVLLSLCSVGTVNLSIWPME